MHKGRATTGGIGIPFTTAMSIYSGGKCLKRSELRPNPVKLCSSVLVQRSGKVFCDCTLGSISAY